MAKERIFEELKKMVQVYNTETGVDYTKIPILEKGEFKYIADCSFKEKEFTECIQNVITRYRHRVASAARSKLKSPAKGTTKNICNADPAREEHASTAITAQTNQASPAAAAQPSVETAPPPRRVLTYKQMDGTSAQYEPREPLPAPAAPGPVAAMPGNRRAAPRNTRR